MAFDQNVGWMGMVHVHNKVAGLIERVGELYGIPLKMILSHRGNTVILKIPNAGWLSEKLSEEIVGTPQNVTDRIIPILDSLIRV